jgi:hypothetical protein
MAKVMKGGSKKARKRKPPTAEQVGPAKARAEAQAADETRTHNSRARKDIIRDVCREVEALEADRDTLSKQIRNVKNVKIKGALGMKIADFNAALRVYKLDRDDRAVFMETLQETFKALGVGEQLDFLSASAATDRKVEAKTQAEKTAALKIADQEGYEAGKAGKWPPANPHPANTDEHRSWEAGRLRGQESIAAKMGDQAAAGNA